MCDNSDKEIVENASKITKILVSLSFFQSAKTAAPPKLSYRNQVAKNIHHLAHKLLLGCSQDTSERLVDILHQVLTDPEATTTFLTRAHSSEDALQSFKTDL
jgi:hypothetical protein